jgi:hypothetical protein
MQAAISAEDYLAGELKSDIRHEYLGGLVYAMAGTGSRWFSLVVPLAPLLRLAAGVSKLAARRR